MAGNDIPIAVDNVTNVNAALLNSIRDAILELEDGTTPAGSLDVDALPSPGMDALDGENDAIPCFNVSAGALQKIRPNAVLKIGSAGAGSLGELVTWDGSDSVALAPGSDGDVLTVDSTAPEGLAWVAPGGGGGSVQPSQFDGRLTLTSATPITTADVTGASTIYLTPYRGDGIALYDGSAWQEHILSEISLSLSGLTSGANYDVFCYDNSGTPALELSAAWTNDTTRADALTTIAGVRVKDGATTRRLVGTIRTTGTTTTEDSAAKRFVRNERHPVARVVKYVRTSSPNTTWNYNLTTWRKWNNDASAQVEALVSGSETVRLQAAIRCYQIAAIPTIGIGVDSLTPSQETQAWNHAASHITIRGAYVATPSEGYHYFAAVEKAENTNTAQWAEPGVLIGEVLC